MFGNRAARTGHSVFDDFDDLEIKRRTDEKVQWTSLTFGIIFQIDSDHLARAISFANPSVD